MDNNKFKQLRQKAESMIKNGQTSHSDEFIGSMNLLLEELNIYQIELELQNQELQQTNVELELERKRFKDLYMQAPVAYFTLNSTGNIIELNQAAAQLLNLPIQRFRYTSIFPYIAPESKADFVKNFKNLFNFNQSNYGKLTFLAHDEKKIFTKLSAVCYHDQQFNEKLCRCAAIDISAEVEQHAELTQAEQELKYYRRLQESEQRLQHILDALPLLASYVDKNLTYRFVNRMYERFLNKSIEEIRGKIVPDVIGEQAFNKTKSYIEQVLTGKSVHYQLDLMYPDGLIHTMQAWLIPLFSAEQQIEGYHAFLQDITERKQAEKNLQRLAAIVEATDDAVISKTLDGIITSWNPAAERLFGYTEVEMLGSPILRLFPPHVYHEETWIIQQIKSGKRINQLETIRIDKYNRQIDVSATISPIKNSKNQVIAVSTILRDITKRKQIETALKNAKQQAEVAAQAKSEFLANMSHEIRTPLNAIIGLTKLMLESKLERNQYDSLTKIQRSSQMLLGIINDILDFSKIEAGKLELEQHNFCLDEILDHIRSLFTDSVGKKQLDFYFYLPVDLNVELIGDSFRLQQILINLVSNAVKFTETGSITLKVTNLHHSAENIKLKFEVIDTGIGISAKNAQKLFTAFSQADTSITRKFGGSGLGLVISSRLVEAMGGKLTFTSHLAQGSNFNFILDFGIAQVCATQSAVINEIAKLKILLADSKATDREIIANILHSWGGKVVQVAEEQELIAAITTAKHTNNEFDLLFVGCKHLTQTELINKIKPLRQLPYMPRLILTAYSKEDIPVDFNDFDAFLSKPVTASNLQLAIAEAMGKLAVPITPERIIPNFIGKNILLVEDQEINQEVALRWLQKTAAQIAVANNGQEAVLAVEKTKFDLILMDIQMPVMDGYTATKIIKHIQPELPIIALSAAVLAQDRIRAYQAGMDDHLKKPIDEQELFATLARYLSHDSFLHQPKQDTVFVHKLRGFDTVSGMRVASNDANFYIRQLQRFKLRLKEELGNIATIIRQGDLNTAENLSHALKGLAATLGANELANIAGQINNYCKNAKMPDLESITKLELITATTIEELELLSAEDVQPTSHQVTTTTKAAAAEFVVAISQNIVPENDTINLALQYFASKSDQQTITDLRKFIEKFDYVSAIDTINKINQV